MLLYKFINTEGVAKFRLFVQQKISQYDCAEIWLKWCILRRNVVSGWSSSRTCLFVSRVSQIIYYSKSKYIDVCVPVAKFIQSVCICLTYKWYSTISYAYCIILEKCRLCATLDSFLTLSFVCLPYLSFNPQVPFITFYRIYYS